ncbi:hypothetical protein BJV78DRAFT_1173209 [Lactifluus subvellereus]|nr:hypothetical protein BJV78DRAFT_1173209 [Lactifluus subvellereus]
MPTSSQSQQSPEPLANAPFDDTRADVILRSSDGVNFRVFKIILSLASPIFADMFSIPQPTPNEFHTEPPVVTLSEDSKTLDFALRHLYPVEHPTEIELRDACTLIEFARKYQVKALGPVIARSLTDAIESDPTGVYATAVTYGEADIAIKAARSSLKRPISHLKPSQLQCATAVLYGELIRYHIACGEAASAVTSQREWFPCEIGGMHHPGCHLQGRGRHLRPVRRPRRTTWNKKIRASVCMELPIPFGPRSCTSPNCRSSRYGRIHTGFT